MVQWIFLQNLLSTGAGHMGPKVPSNKKKRPKKSMLARTHVWDKENISRFQEEVLWSGVLSAARAASDGPSGKLQTFPPSNACQRE